MLDTYDFDGDVWLCHSFGGKCHDYTAFVRFISSKQHIIYPILRYENSSEVEK